MWLTLCACVVHGTPLHHHRYVALRHGQSEANVQGIISSAADGVARSHSTGSPSRSYCSAFIKSALRGRVLGVFWTNLDTFMNTRWIHVGVLTLS